MIPGRSKDVLDEWLAERDEDWCAGIRLATLDPAACYRRALTDHLPNVTLVGDHFHTIRLANRAIDDVRRRIQQESLGHHPCIRHRGRKGDPLYRICRILLTADERLSEDRFAWMQAMLTRGDPGGEVAVAWIADELLRHVYATCDEAHARRPMIGFFTCGARTPTFESSDASTEPSAAVQNRSSPTTGGASNGRVENTHMLAEKICRIGHGCTTTTTAGAFSSAGSASEGHTQPTARIPGRQPRIIVWRPFPTSTSDYAALTPIEMS